MENMSQKRVIINDFNVAYNNIMNIYTIAYLKIAMLYQIYSILWLIRVIYKEPFPEEVKVSYNNLNTLKEKLEREFSTIKL